MRRIERCCKLVAFLVYFNVGRTLIFAHNRFYDFILQHNNVFDELSRCSSVFCLGAGTGAELTGIIAAWLRCRKDESTTPTSLEQDRGAILPPPSVSCSPNRNPIRIHIQDVCDYTSCVGELTTAMAQWSIPLVETRFTIADAASPNSEEYMTTHIAESDIVTSFFILNELLESDKSGFVRLMTRMVTHMKQNALWIVIDSAGSFSSHHVGKGDYMAYTFLDMLTGFTILAKSDACWYRVPASLSYPTPLQNSRYYYRILCKHA